jgi:aminoglycoside phosphotransferase
MRREHLTGEDVRRMWIGRSRNAVVAETDRHVIKIAWCAPLRADIEAASWRTARAAGLPAPELESQGRVRDRDYMVYSRLPGCPSPTRREALREAGAMLAALHAAPVDGFPRALDSRPRRMRRFPLAERFIDMRHAELPPQTTSCVRLAEQDWATAFHTPTHGDFRGPNLLARGKRISGVLDWSDARRASREADLGSLERSGFPDVLDGYLAAAPAPRGALLLGYLAARYGALAATGVVPPDQALDAIGHCASTLHAKNIDTDPGDTSRP